MSTVQSSQDSKEETKVNTKSNSNCIFLSEKKKCGKTIYIKPEALVSEKQTKGKTLNLVKSKPIKKLTSSYTFKSKLPAKNLTPLLGVEARTKDFLKQNFWAIRDKNVKSGSNSPVKTQLLGFVEH